MVSLGGYWEVGILAGGLVFCLQFGLQGWLAGLDVEFPGLVRWV